MLLIAAFVKYGLTTTFLKVVMGPYFAVFLPVTLFH